jgi:UDP-glucose:(heptosyl)LPS alpha-1,3-glucosyltransferase
VKLALICRPFTFHGGVETATAGLVRALVTNGHEVHLYSPPGQESMPGVVRHRLPLPRLPALARVIWMALATARLGRDCDVVQSHERTLHQDVYRAGEGCHRAYLDASLGSPPRDFPGSAVPGGVDSGFFSLGSPAAAPRTATTSHGRRRAGAYHQVVQALEALTFRRSRRIVAIARRGAQEIARLYGVPAGRLRVVYNGVDLERFHPDNRGRYRRETRRELGLDPGAWVVLFVGSGFARKGLDLLVEGFAGVPDSASRLVIVGKGDPAPYAALASRFGVADRLVWVGPRRDTERLYGAADALALPSRYEPFGNVHLEALASGVPVLTSSATGGAELIEPGRNGWIVEPDNPGAITDGLERLRAGRVDEWTVAARRSAEPFTYEAQAAAFEKIYAEITALRPVSR